MRTAHDDTLYAATVAERRRLVTILEGLAPDEWDRDSLCDGWRVREVVAHITMAYRYSGWSVFRGILKERGNFNRFADRAAKHDASVMTEGDLLQSLATNVENPWRPPGGGQAGALSHDVIHGLDITEALGLEPPPVETIRHVLGNSGPRNLKFFGVDLNSNELVATDADWKLGDGTPIRLSAKDILLVITARKSIAEVFTSQKGTS